MKRHALVVVALCAGLVAGCAADDNQLTLMQVERRVSMLVGDNEGGHAEAKCSELPEDRGYRCKVSVNGLPSEYDARVSKDAEKIELEKR